MKQAFSTFLVLSAALIALSSCVTTPAVTQMREANAMLKQASEKTQQGNFAEADNAAAAIGRSVRSGVELAPIAQNKGGGKVDLKPMLTAWESSSYKDLRKALKRSDEKSAAIAFTQLRGQCTNCHAAIGRPNINVN
ncbi:MAG: hypothetical protein QM496_01685 [Verrucomicrobiota bacterium]